MFLKCPKRDLFLEYVSISTELPLWKRAFIRTHSMFCNRCKEETQKIQTIWSDYFTPEPDVTSSILKVFSRLKKDETLILKGWKLGLVSRRHGATSILLKEGWLFRGAVSFGFAALLIFVLIGQLRPESPNTVVTGETHFSRRFHPSLTPVAKIRVEDKNRVQVHYVQPELLQSIEFETTGTSR